MRSFGILTFAFGLDYARHAYGLALSAKVHKVPTCVVTSPNDLAYPYLLNKGVQLQAVTRTAHDPFWYEQFAYDNTPFEVTLKMDADCLIPADANMKLVRDLIERHNIINGIPHTLTHTPVYDTPYRDREKSWGLPTVYSTMFGFTRCTEAHLFYEHVKTFCTHWGSDVLPMTKDVPLTTDSLYSMAWAACHSPSSALMGLPFHHMKPGTMDWGAVREDWTREVPYHIKGSRVYVGGHCVSLPIHYQDKLFMNDNVINELEAACS